MKKILVIDDSRAVRETLALILGRDFLVIQRPHLEERYWSRPDEPVDLLILGISAHSGQQHAAFLSMESQSRHPVLFLLESKSAVDSQARRERLDYLAKPFNPYELREKVERLLGSASIAPQSPAMTGVSADQRLIRYVEFPYVSASTSALAKRFALTSFPILISSEVGCGGEQMARAIHSLNQNAGRWVSIHTGAMEAADVLSSISGKIACEPPDGKSPTLFFAGLETLDASAQTALLEFLQEAEAQSRSFWILSHSSEDLLERVYRKQFLAPLYYRLATLTLRLRPLRERTEDIMALATCLAREYGQRLGIGEVGLSVGAVDRLSNYLWFGNLEEMEAVIARTLAIHRKRTIEAADLVLGASDGEAPLPTVTSQGIGPGPVGSADPSRVEARVGAGESQAGANGGNGSLVHGRVLINELAHELKNPMVTIKTFAQLLGDRYDDATFRSRFRETVSGDIERMDGLLEALLDFSRFTYPRKEKILLYDELRKVFDGLLPECIKRGATLRWGPKRDRVEVLVDREQMHYIAANVLRAVLEQIEPRGDIQVEVEAEGKIVFNYTREGGRLSPLTHYLGLSAAMEEALPLRILLVKLLLERNGGEIKVDYFDGGKVLIGIGLVTS